ncbi:MAG: hypothetical protein KBT11_01415 [Treponema sp.]|nr:hypothetical protein [Candidatus Treponema equifaecale]
MMKNLFMKIQLLSHISDCVVQIGLQHGFSNFADMIDMNCGAIPEGDFENVIDPSSADQFLNLYAGIAESRFAAAVTVLLGTNSRFMPLIEDVCLEIGQEFKDENMSTAQDALSLIDAVILEGMAGAENRKITLSTPEKVCWKVVNDFHAQHWEKYSGDVKNYYHLQKCFIDGMLEGTGIKFEQNGSGEFILWKQQ